MVTKNPTIEELLKKFDEDGYVVLKLDGVNDLIDEVNSDVDKLIESGEYRTNSKIYSYIRSWFLPRACDVPCWKFPKK